MEGGDNSIQKQSAPESSREIPVHPQPSLWHHGTGTFIGGHDQQAEITSSTHHHEDFFDMLPNVEILSPPPPPFLPPAPPSSMMLPNIESASGFKSGESSGTKRTSSVFLQVPHTQCEVSTQEAEREEQQQPPRTKRRRCPQVHNLSERTRRGRITEKIKTLKELIPNSKKADKASVLADAVEHIKCLQQQVQNNQMKSTYQNMVAPYYSPYFPIQPMMGLGYGMGMCNSVYPTGFPMVPFPQGLNPFGEYGFQLRYPSASVSQPPTETMPAATMSTETMSIGSMTATPSTSITSLSSTYSRGESSSVQSIRRIDEADFHQTQIASQVVFHVDEQAQKFHHDSAERR